MRFTSLILALALASPLVAATSSTSPRTSNNDDSCDISVLPAATLLLPYFEVDFGAPQSSARTTLFTIQNVSKNPQIANVTIWSDWAYPVMSFPIFLTGYDVQAVNLYDILARGVVVPGTPSGTSIGTPVPTNPANYGAQPAANIANPNFLPSVTGDCAAGRLPGSIPAALLSEVQRVLTLGKSTGGLLSCPNTAGVQQQLGGVHTYAIGYITIDVVATCNGKRPTDADYFTSTILFDNVLTGDYQQVVPRGATSYALGGPMVHIRAIPEGGAAGSTLDTSLPYTFYDRLTTSSPTRTFDRRQPLPSTFAPRFIQGGPTAFNTTLKIWREASTARDAACNQYQQNGNLPITDIIRFDEHENATVLTGCCCILCPISTPSLPATSSIASSGSVFPPMTSNDVAGWLFVNLNNGGSTSYSVGTHTSGGIPRDFRTGTSTRIGVRQSQAWVTSVLFAEPTYAVESTSVALGNGCSTSPAVAAEIGPAPDATP